MFRLAVRPNAPFRRSRPIDAVALLVDLDTETVRSHIANGSDRGKQSRNELAHRRRSYAHARGPGSPRANPGQVDGGGRWSCFADASDPGGSRNGSTSMRW